MSLALLRERAAMGRTALPPVVESDLDRFLKMIPTEVLAFYVAAITMTSETSSRFLLLVLYVAGTALVPLMLFIDGRNTNARPSTSQYVMRTLTFLAWAAALSWPFTPWAEPLARWLRGALVLVVPFCGAIVTRE